MRVQTKALVQAFRFIIPLVLLLVAVSCTSEPEQETVAPDVPATVRAEVANSLAMAPTATAWPTNTPFPTATPYPTATAYPTGTPVPTGTPWPTATAYPTHTPYPTPTAAPTPTAYPTHTPYPTPTPATILMQQATPTPVPTVAPVRNLEFDFYAGLDATRRGDQILRTHVLGNSNCDRVVDLARELSSQQDTALLKVYNLRIIVSNARRVECAGEARWSRGDNTSIIVFVEHDGDGDVFYGYRLRSSGFEYRN